MITKEYIFSGIVQGMGFRPTALRLATELGITGTVCNTRRGLRNGQGGCP